MEITTFESLGLEPWICKQLKKIGLKQPTDVQKHCIPKILSNRDCVAAAKTGSGKTFAFALPIIQKLAEEPTHNFALVLTPTHELAYQIAEQFLITGQPIGIRVCVVAGGTDQMLESLQLQNRPHIVIAMPGRLEAHLTGCNTFSFDSIKFLVIDEADRMLSGSFDESLVVIEQFLPKTRQNIFFSATLQENLKAKVLFPSSDAYEWYEEASVKTVDTLDQRYVLCTEFDRNMVLFETLRKYKEDHEDGNVIIFTQKKKDCQILSMALNSIGFENVCLHGYMSQKERVSSLCKYKSNIVRILIATDVASRGLDIPNVQFIINHRLPKFANEYIHRVGRTARAGKSGMAVTLFRFPEDLNFLEKIESLINTKLKEHVIDQRLVEQIFMQVKVAVIEAELIIDNSKFDEKAANYRRKKWLEDGLDPEEQEEIWQKSIKEKIKERKARRKDLNKKFPVTTSSPEKNEKTSKKVEKIHHNKKKKVSL
ncbi:CLUMA_CG006240, isoform A [Clunio marinus]|uniref:RNA helicase n=1 Tax=Clunio marinus TaxID=568069 RepID=A0A1J1HXT4_9DIPT|nr:CLUMA_CG006240, isoform A [Clunio marinus]